MTRATTRLAAVAAITVLALTGLTGCGSSSDQGSTSSSPSSTKSSSSMKSMKSMKSSSATKSPSGGTAQQASIMIMDYKFTGTTKVAPGAKIMVMNHDSEAHTVTADSGNAFDVAIPPGKTMMLTAPSKPGSYAYHCTYHADMHGTLTVG